MKRTVFPFAAAAFCAALWLSSCSKDTPITVSIYADEAFGSGHTASVTLTLSRTASSPVLVYLAAGAYESGSMAVDRSRLTFANPVSIPSREKSVTVQVAVNTEGMSSGRYIAVIRIDGVDGGQADSRQFQSYINLTVSGGAPQPEPSSKYDAWLGSWDLIAPNITDGKDSAYFTFTILERTKGSEYSLAYFNNIEWEDCFVPAIYNTDGTLSFVPSEYIELEFDDGSTGTLFFDGEAYLEVVEEPGFYFIGDDTDILGTAVLAADGNSAVITGASVTCVNGNLRETTVVDGFGYYFEDSGGNLGGWDLVPVLPYRMVRASAAAASAPKVKSAAPVAVKQVARESRRQGRIKSRRP